MKHKESETTETSGKHTYPWNMTVNKSFTKIITPGERKAVIEWLYRNGVTRENKEPGPRYKKLGEKTEIFHVSENEPLFIHTRPNYETNEITIRLNSSTATAKELLEDGIIKSPEKSNPQSK